MNRHLPPSRQRPPKYKPKWPWVVAIACVVIAGLALNNYFRWYLRVERQAPQQSQAPAPAPAPASAPSLSSEVIDYAKIKDNSDQNLDQVIRERKEDFGLDKSVDMVVGSEESIRVGDETVPLSEILKQIDNVNGDTAAQALPMLDPNNQEQPASATLTEEKLGQQSTSPAPSSGPSPATSIKKSINYYGVYVVRSGDNLWNIHFAFLREYLKNRGIDVPMNADEGLEGQSTGVSRILKWAESMVHIFNMKTRMLDTNLDLLEPEQKVVIFNLSQLHRILGAIKTEDLDKVRFDGTNLYLPSQPPVQ